MRDAIATTELFAEAPGEARRSFIISIARPRALQDGGWSCRIKMTAKRFDASCEAADSLHALAAALAAMRVRLDRMQGAGWRFYATADAADAIDASRLAIA